MQMRLNVPSKLFTHISAAQMVRKRMENLQMALTVRSFLRANSNNWLENVFEWKDIITLLFTEYMMGCFIGLCLTVRSKMNSNMIVDKLWNGSNALQISRNGLDC